MLTVESLSGDKWTRVGTVPVSPFRDRFIRMTPRLCIATVAAVAFTTACQDSPRTDSAPNAVVDRDLIDVTVPRLHQLYADRK